METDNIRDHYCFCTLALGERYCELAIQLAKDLAHNSPSAPFFVLTDRPEKFVGIKNTIVVKHRKKSVEGYNDKLCVVNKALALFDTCILLDADMRVLGPVKLDKEFFEPGIKVYELVSWVEESEEALFGEPARWKSNALRIMRILRKELNLKQDDKDIPYVTEFLFAVTKFEKVDIFLNKWNELAEFCEKQRMFRWEGLSIGLAALLTESPISKNSFTGLKFFEPTKFSMRDHLHGDRSIIQEVYDELTSSINSKKYQHKPKRNFINLEIDNLRRRIPKLYRYIKIKLFGLDLLAN